MSTIDKVKSIIADQLGKDVADVRNEASFIDDLGADSLAVVELMMAFEEEFDCEIPDEEAASLKTVQDVISYIESKTQAAA